MQDGNYIESDEDHEPQINLDEELGEEEDITVPLNPDSAIHKAIKNIKKELAANHISGKNNNINSQLKKFPLIPLDKLASFLLKFVKQANLSLFNRRILFAAITPIHHIYLHIINFSNDKNALNQSSQTSLYTSYEPNSFKKCVDYFIKVFNLIQYDSQQINENFFIQQFEKIIEDLHTVDENYFNEMKNEINENIEALRHNFKKLHDYHSINNISNKHIQRCKVELKRLKLMILSFFESDSEQNLLKSDFLGYYNNFYSEFKNFELFYKVNIIISQFKENWDQPLFWFLPCQMAKVDSDDVFNSAMEYLQTFWMTCDLNIIKSDNTESSHEKSDNDNSSVNIKNNNNNDDDEKSDTDKSENGSTDFESSNDPEEVRIKMFDVLELLSFQNKLEPKNFSIIAGSFMRIVNNYNTNFIQTSTLSPTSFDIEDIKTIVSIVSVLPYTMKDVVCQLNFFLSERVKLLKHYLYVYNGKINRKSHKCSTLSSLISTSSFSSTSSTSSLGQQILCNASFGEIFTYTHSFVIFAYKAKETPALYPMIKDELHRLMGFYSELLLKAQMMNDSRILSNEALKKANEFSIANSKSFEAYKREVGEDAAGSEKEDTESVDVFRALKELANATRRVLATNFIKEEKRDFMERFYTFLKICCPYIENLKQQQLKTDRCVNMLQIKSFLSDAFPLFDTLEIFRFDTENLEEPQIKSFSSGESDEHDRDADDVNTNLNSDDILKDIDLKSVWSNENKEILFNKSFPSIREQARRLQVGVSDDWRSVFVFKSIYKTFCRLFLIREPQLPINEHPSEFESDIHNFFSFAACFFMDKDFVIHESSIPLSTIIEAARSLSIKWMFSNTSSIEKAGIESGIEKVEGEEVTASDKQHWDYSSLLFGIAFISVPHPIQTINVFLMMLSSREGISDAESRQLTTFSDLFTSFVEGFNSDTIDNLGKNSTVRSCFSLFESSLDFFYTSSNQKENSTDEEGPMLFSSIRKQNIKEIINEMVELKEKYSKLSSMMTMMNVKYFDKPDSYSRLFVEIAFYANILKSFKDTLEIVKKFDFIQAPYCDSDLNSTWPFSPGFLDLDMYKNDFPGFLASLHSTIFRMTSMKPNHASIRRTFDFYMCIVLSTYTFCFSGFNQTNSKIQSKENSIGQRSFGFKNSPENDLSSDDEGVDGESRFAWNRSNYGSQRKPKPKDDSDIIEDILQFKKFKSQAQTKTDCNECFSCIEQSIADVRANFHALAVLYSNKCSERPSTLLCCDVLARATDLIKLLEGVGLSDFKVLSTLLSGLSEVTFAIICALNIKKEVDRVVNATIYFASLFGIKLSKSPNLQFTVPIIPKSEAKKEQQPATPLVIRAAASSSQLQTQRPIPISPRPQIPAIQISQQPQITQNQSTPSVQIVPQNPQQAAHSLSPGSKKKRKERTGNAKVKHSKSGKLRRSRSVSEDDKISSLSDFTSLSTSFERAAPVFERMAEMAPPETPDIQHFYRARSLFTSLHNSLSKIKVPTSAGQFGELIRRSNARMEKLELQSRSHLRRLRLKIESVDQKFKKMQSMIESDYSCITQKIEDETIKGEQLDEDITNVRAELKRMRKGKTATTARIGRNLRRKSIEKSGLNANSNLNACEVLNFNFNSQFSSRSVKQKPIAKAQLIMAQAQELQRQNNLIQIQLQKNEIELSILNSLNDENSQKNFFEKESSINDVVMNILENAADVPVMKAKANASFDVIDDDDKQSNVLSKSSILAIVSDIKKWEEQQQNITTIDHSELCDRVELLAYSLISATKAKESEMIKMQNQLKSVKNSQRDKLLKLRNVLREIDLDEE